ncbi:membrane dipeptidase [Kitasatospora sp. DSM 101779]|uniref:membrane dipeptidase n=1 Tax=Kitasatospora sp. DSM 101779 TaxID=2853165 RepID=UPI0021DB2D2D|nr:membrane dipeptidase [Kitasatospora sp. DSM 101779]
MVRHGGGGNVQGGVAGGLEDGQVVGGAAAGCGASRTDRGVRVVQLTYNQANQLGDGSMAPENRGLTPLGHRVVEALNDSRLMVDLSHSGERTCLPRQHGGKR